MTRPLTDFPQLMAHSRWRWCMRLVLTLGLAWGLVMTPLPVRAQQPDPVCLDVETITAQFNARGYSFICVPDNWNLYHIAGETWYRGPKSLANIQRIQQEVFVSQFKAGQYDDYVRGDPPAWQHGTALQWQRDFAGIGYRQVTQDQNATRAIPLFFIAMWANQTLEVDSLAAALSAQPDTYTTITLEALTLRYLDGEEAVPPQMAYVLDGTQMQDLFNLDSGFLNSKYVIIQPTEASHTLTGIPVFAFFSSAPIALADLEPLLQSLQFRHRLPPAQPDPAQVVHLQTPLGLLELVPALQAEATAWVAEWHTDIRDQALTFAREIPYTNLLPFQLLTSATNLYWAPAGLQTGRLILWYYTGGAHGNVAAATWTFTTTGQPVALPDLLTVSEDEALALITEAAIAHLQYSAADMSAAESRDWVTSGLTSLEAISGWNPVIHHGRQGLWITLEPYVIAPYYLGVQEFFVPMDLQLAD